ncbi:Serine/threonine protein kinase [Bifidobacterium bohemicum]|uniref:non-specific serine/threonine protein kinase n=1 Tax=Bifidobacterium bohemicum DSM 22767 TaxID=1437606 RepID=A0A086ZGU6_9BIFI|nr:serine/threonine-protein kinase [Bifidobacterium bohemicum]KFI45746.1 serine/threonine protein kinase [Bifidobacterium bohemicum DSM 22767]SCC08473.1 Serine/threonine protein kinase [Bifidobacterium bohemicum]
MPPVIPGCDYLRLLGSGSTADVYLYHQHTPNRDVAVKVGKQQTGHDPNTAFANEADIMASLSTHPYILSIYGFGFTVDDLPYLILEYAPHGSYKEIMLARTMDARQTIDLGIKLAGALETAHRHGIIHRDIKPANILVTSQGLPALSDFGIATSVYDAKTQTGFSVPWAPPEVLTGEGGGDEAADIYSLATSLYALLVGKSPFEYWFQPHTSSQLAHHIVEDRLPKLDPSIAPKQLDSVLRKAMSKEPSERYASALKFARALQAVQQECFGTMTPLVAEDAEPLPARSGNRSANVALPASSERTRINRSEKPLLIALAAVAAIAVVVAAFAFIVGPNMDAGRTKHGTHVGYSDTPSPEERRSEDKEDTAQTSQTVPSPTELSGHEQGSIATFTWRNPNPKPGDTYAWSTLTDGSPAPGQTSVANETSVDVPVDPGSTQTCIQVSIIRKDGRMSNTPATACAVNKD